MNNDCNGGKISTVLNNFQKNTLCYKHKQIKQSIGSDFVTSVIDHPSTLEARKLTHFIRNLLIVKFTINLHDYFHNIRFLYRLKGQFCRRSIDAICLCPIGGYYMQEWTSHLANVLCALFPQSVNSKGHPF